MRPFSLDSADQFRPGGPPALGSKKWAREYNEVKEIGSSTSTIRTAEQTLAARFWAEAPVQQAHGALPQVRPRSPAGRRGRGAVHGDGPGDLCRRDHRLLRRQVPLRVLAADHRDPRRRHGRQRRDRRRSTWSTLLAGTPNHPEYPSAHSCVTPAAGLVIAEFLGTPEIDFTIPSLTGLGDRHYARAKDLSTRSRTPASGADPLPLRGRGRGRDRQEDRPPGARAPLPAVERLEEL